MNKKLIATAVAGALVTPAAAMAQAEIDPYFRIANALDYTDVDGGDGTTDLRNVSSRIGIRGSYDLGNGTTVLGQYEFSTFTDVEGSQHEDDTANRGGINDTRIGIVGIDGNFGRVTAGNQWSSFYNIVGIHLDPTYTLGFIVYSSQMQGPYRSSNTVKYANSFGPVYVEVDGRWSTDSDENGGGADVERLGGDNGEDFLDGIGIGANFNVTEAITLSAAYDTEQYDVLDDQERIGAGIKAEFGNLWGSLAYMSVDQDGIVDNELFGVYGGGVWGNTSAFAGYLDGDDNLTGTQPSQVLLHANHKLGDGPLRLFYEATFVDLDGAGADFDTHLVGMRIDF